jgi:enoyl-CoA hydratase
VSGFVHVTVEAQGDVVVVTMNRPPVNAVSQPMYEELTHVFSHIEALAPDAHAVILTSEGKHFCGGNDLQEFLTMDGTNVTARMLVVRTAFNAIYDSSLPVIAAVRGVAVGTGVALAGSCDLVVAAEGATFTLPEIGVGAMGGAKHLSRLVPQGIVRLMHLTGRGMTAEQLVPFGGIAEVVSSSDLLSAAWRLAAEITQHSPAAIRFAKRSLNTIEYMDLKAGYEFEQGLTGELCDFPDAKEAIRAFFEQRQPHFTGEHP